MHRSPSKLIFTRSGSGQVEELGPGAWRLEIPAGGDHAYRLAQLDDTHNLRRRDFLWRPPLLLRLEGRASDQHIPGTWGFGLWNDPFTLSLELGGGMRRFPAPPNAAWFFFASEPNYLSLRDDLPACGGLAAVFSSPGWASALAVLSAPAAPLLAVRPLARLARRLGSRIIRQDAARLDLDPRLWHNYELEWTEDRVCMRVDQQTVLQTAVSPRPPLGCVVWVDNQYAAWTPDGRLSSGLLANPTAAWIELHTFSINLKLDNHRSHV